MSLRGNFDVEAARMVAPYDTIFASHIRLAVSRFGQ